MVGWRAGARGVQLVLRKWERKKRKPDAVVIEHPGLAGGHLGAAKVADLHDEVAGDDPGHVRAVSALRAGRIAVIGRRIAWSSWVRSCE